MFTVRLDVHDDCFPVENVRENFATLKEAKEYIYKEIKSVIEYSSPDLGYEIDADLDCYYIEQSNSYVVIDDMESVYEYRIIES